MTPTNACSMFDSSHVQSKQMFSIEKQVIVLLIWYKCVHLFTSYHLFICIYVQNTRCS